MIGKFVAGEGSYNAQVMIIGEGPGRMEASLGRPFMGAAGMDLNRLLMTLCGLSRQDVWVTNLVRYRTDEENSDPTQDDIQRDEPYLQAELYSIKPRVIVTVGAVSTRYFLGQDVNMEFIHALPHRSDKTTALIFPVYHPAAGLHQADKFSKLVYNSFKRLGMYLRGELSEARDAFPNPLYTENPDNDVLLGGLIAVDTEGIPKQPWGLSLCTAPGTASVLPLATTHLVKEALENSPILYHNSLWDLKVLRAMGINPSCTNLHDSMIMAHLLCVEPKKLKALAYREAGMEMENYVDVIKEADDKIALAYLERAASYKCETCRGLGEVTRPWKKNPNKTTKEKCGTCLGDGTTWPQAETRLVFNDDFTAKLYTPDSVGKRLRGFLASDGDYRSKWNKLDASLKDPIEVSLGLLPGVILDDVTPRERVVRYSARDADATLRVYHALSPRIKAMGLEEAYRIDLGCIPIIDRMHENGILINKDHFYDLDKKFEKMQLEVLQKLHDEVGVYFNPSSPVQIKKELAKLGLKDLESTDEKTLKLLKLKAKDPKVGKVIDYGLQYRELNKLRGTYAQKLPREADSGSRIHTTFILSAQEKTDGETAEAPSTSRLSSRDPNLQNIPTATDLGNLIRAGFIAKPGCKLLSVDLSQIELRVGAHLAHEDNMIAAFNSGLDLHTFTASKMFKVPYDQVDKKKHRYPAKTISFGIFYGMSKYRLQSELAVEGLVISLDEAQAFIDAWFATYPGIKTYAHNVQAEARQNSFVRTLFGHIRYLPNVHSKDDRAREEALRQAGNHPVQGTAGEILKIAMANVHKRVYPDLNRLGYFEPLLTIHDELIFEVEAGIADLASAMVSYEMCNAVKLLVPLESSSKIADNWSQLKD